MADKKISQLTSAATPLAGTEVLPIVQSGSTVKVPVSDLTSGRAVATGNLTVTGTATISSNAAMGTATPRTAANKTLLTIDGAWGGQVDIGVSGVSHAQFGSDNYDTGVQCRIQSGDNIVFKVNGGTAIGYMTANGFAPNAGKGIDFSANTHAPGMTSELLDWYEEGTWTPSIGGDATYLQQFGRYVRVGQQVTVSFVLQVNVKGTGSATTISGLPFAVGSTNQYHNAGALAYFDTLALSVVSITPRAVFGSSTIDFSILTAAASAVTTSGAVIGNGTYFIGSMTYLVD